MYFGCSLWSMSCVGGLWSKYVFWLKFEDSGYTLVLAWRVKIYFSWSLGRQYLF